MPTTYTHDIFGKEVYEQLPDEIKKVIRSGKSLYLTGLHGPDILFYHLPFLKNKIYDTGMQMHQKESADFFCRAIVRYQEEPSDLTMAYILGFGCHLYCTAPAIPMFRNMKRAEGSLMQKSRQNWTGIIWNGKGKILLLINQPFQSVLQKKGVKPSAKFWGA